MKRNTKLILLVIFILIAAAAFSGYYYYNKGPVSVEGRTGQKVKAENLYQEYLGNKETAQAKFSGQVVSVTGRVASLDKNQNNETIILLDAGHKNARINCTMEQENITAMPGSTITIKGLCSGMGEGDADMGLVPDVYLTKAFIEL
ncbi:MAG: hypothetical protein ABIU55_11445 [Ferruginibacter sp.]